MRKSFAALIAATCVVSASAAAQENWPQRQVTIVMRSATAPDLPTIGETLKDYEATARQGLFAPAGTPSPIILSPGRAPSVSDAGAL
jgi:tripartite-type tricarboxylate transporter receptor subunit TctC